MPVMNPTLAASHPVAPPAKSRTRLLPIAAAVLFLAVIWAEIINHLRAEWSYNPQYSYGWSVPLLMLYLLQRRWLERPPAGITNSIVPSVLFLIGALLLLPLRFLAEANPDWRLLSWAMAGVALSVSLAFCFQLGGRRWLRHFAFPLVFFLVAVPWPMQFEQVIIQNLMRLVTAINVFFLSVAGIPALQHGNLIEVNSGMIGIEEACSGVRSLQATLMVSLFLGELYSFTVLRRGILVITGAALAFFCNIVRTSMLVWVGARRGTESIEAWHDPAGLTILLVCLFGLWGLSLLMSRSVVKQPGTTPSDAIRLGSRVPAALLLTLVFIIAGGELAIGSWYRSHLSELAASRWTVRWPQTNSGYADVPIPSATQGILRYDKGGGATWVGNDSNRWLMYFFRWLPGRTAALFVKIHRPDVCLPASGLTMVRDDGIRLVEVNGIRLPVRTYRFDHNGTPLHVIYCYWDARSSYDSVNAAVEEDWTARGRVGAALKGRREIGAQMIELVVWGYDDDAQANQALERQLAAAVQPET
jgi:exosortase